MNQSRFINNKKNGGDDQGFSVQRKCIKESNCPPFQGSRGISPYSHRRRSSWKLPIFPTFQGSRGICPFSNFPRISWNLPIFPLSQGLVVSSHFSPFTPYFATCSCSPSFLSFSILHPLPFLQLSLFPPLFFLHLHNLSFSRLIAPNYSLYI